MEIPYPQLFKAIIEQTEEGIALANPDGNYVLVNPALSKMTGYSQEELLTMNVRNLVPIGTELKVFPKVKNQSSGRRILELKHKNGSHFLVEINGYPVQIKGQTFILGIVRDVTKDKLQELELQKREQQAVEHLKQTEHLHKLVNQLNRANSLQEVYEFAVQGISTVLQADRSSLLLFEEDERVHFKAWHNLSKEYRQKVDGHCPWQIDDVDAELLLYETIPSPDFSPELNDAILNEGISAVLFVPLSQPNWLLGKFMVYFDQPHSFSEQELQLAQVIAQNLSAIISRLELMEEMKQTTEKLQHTVNALRQGEDTIAELAEFNQSIVDSAPIGIVTIDLAGKFTSVNQAFLDMVGSPNLENTLNLEIDIPALKAVRFNEIVSQVIATGEIVSLKQLVYTSHWGKRITVNLKVVPQKQEDGRITGAIIVIDDVTADTEAKKLQTAVSQIAYTADNVKTLDELFHNIHKIVQTALFADNFYIALYEKSENSIFFPYFVDENNGELISFRREFKSGLTEYILHHSKSLLVNEEQYLSLVAQNEIEIIGHVPKIYLGVPLILNGEAIGVMAIQHYQDPYVFGALEKQMLEYIASQVAQTIDRKQKETALRKSEAQFRLLAHNFRDALVVVDRKLRKTLYANPSIYKIFDFSPKEVAKKGFEPLLEELIHPEDHLLLQQLFLQANQNREQGNNEILEIEYRICRRDGETRWLRQYSYPYPVEDGSPTILYLVLTDITKRRRAEIAREESNQQLQKALVELKETQENMIQRERLAAVGQMAAGIAHDFNNIMAVIVLYTEMSLQSKKIAAKLRKRLKTVLRESLRATELVQQILDFSRKAVLEPKPMQLIPFLKEQVKLLKRTLPENIHIHLDSTDEGLTIHADPTRIQQIIMNLTVNARDALPSGGHIWIEVKNAEVKEDSFCAACQRPFSGRWIQLSVKDNGSGIAPETLSHIFEPFFTTKAVGAGSGLGLSQVVGTVDQHGGHLHVKSKLGKGTTFFIFLPPATVPPIAMIKETDTAVIPNGNMETVLIVEDEAAIREAFVDTLSHLNYQVVSANNGRHALSILEKKQSKIDLIISDLIMPEMGGQALFHALQKRNIFIPTILLSGYPLSADLQKMQEDGIAGWLPKPPGIAELAHLLQQTLAKRP